MKSCCIIFTETNIVSVDISLLDSQTKLTQAAEFIAYQKEQLAALTEETEKLAAEAEAAAGGLSAAEAEGMSVFVVCECA